MIMPSDMTTSVVRENQARIRMLAVAGPILCSSVQTRRVLGLLENRKKWGLAPPLAMLAVHNPEETEAAERFRSTTEPRLAQCKIMPQKGHNETMGNAIGLHRSHFEHEGDAFSSKREILNLTRRGGKGKPRFVSPFLGGAGTTCGKWTFPMVRKADGTITKGFMKASVAVGFCPVGCPYCYLNMPYTDGMDVALNLEDLAEELKAKWSGYVHPINFGETSGLVEYDEWFASESGEGSIVQSVIDACAEANVTPFFLTKIRYPRYLRFDGTVQVGISLMPEAVRKWVAPNGSPARELLEGLAWAVSAGAVDPVIRLTVIWQQIDEYPPLLEQCRELLGNSGWRLTLDILRFTPTTASIIQRRYPEAASNFAAEIEPEGRGDLRELAREAKRGTKKIRPPMERQAEIYGWFRNCLDEMRCSEVLLTPCKGDPDELLPLVRREIVNSMPCACFRAKGHNKSGAERI